MMTTGGNKSYQLINMTPQVHFAGKEPEEEITEVTKKNINQLF